MIDLQIRETEIMDVGPVDIFSTMSKHFIDSLPDWFLPPTVRKQAIDCKFHWVTEAGPGVEARLTGAIRLNPTVHYSISLDHFLC